MLKCGHAVLFAAVLTVFMPVTASAGDRHAGYYYPEAQFQETYTASAQTLPDVNCRARIAFLTGLTSQKNAVPDARPSGDADGGRQNEIE